MALNKVALQGRLTKDPELRYTKSEKPVASFSIAVDRNGRDAGTDFINCVAWNATAQFVDKYFTKGSAIIIDGRLQMRDWEDKDGHKRTSAEVVADNVYFGGDKKKAEIAPGNFEDLTGEISEEGLPF